MKRMRWPLLPHRAPAPTPPDPDLDFLYAEARAQLNNQLDNFDAANATVGIVVGLAGTQAAIAAAALALVHPSETPIAILRVGVVSDVVSLLAFAYIVATAFTMKTVLVVGPDLDDVSQLYQGGASRAVVKSQVIRSLQLYLMTNRRLFEAGAKLRYRTTRALMVQSTAALLALLVFAVPSLFLSSGVIEPKPAELRPAPAPANPTVTTSLPQPTGLPTPARTPAPPRP